MFDALFRAISSEMAVDLGSATTRIHVEGRGLCCEEPSLVAIQEDRQGRRRVLAVGEQALAMEGRTPPDVRVVRPIQGGVITDFEVAEAMLRCFVTEVQGRRLWVGPRISIAIPYGTTEVEKRALRDAAEASGARVVQLVERPLAAAVGVELPVEEARGIMVVDVGAGSTEIAVISLGGVVYNRTIRVGGIQMDRAIMHQAKGQLGIEISRQEAERAKLAIGSALPGAAHGTINVRGRHASEGFPREGALFAEDVRAALAEPVGMIVDAVLRSLESTPPDLAVDIVGTGIVLVGGGAKLHGLDRLIGDATGLAVIVPQSPEAAVVAGITSAPRTTPAPMRAVDETRVLSAAK